jgi:uncharacterized protein YndB with AHSA1/START domain
VAAKKEETTLEIKRTFTAPREKVFRAWTEAKQLIQWFAPADDFSTSIAELDVRTGGRYRIQMHSPDGKTHTVMGIYHTVEPPERLAFTWSWESKPEEGETLVTLEFVERGNLTELMMTHELFRNGKVRDSHKEGWAGCLGRLQKLFAS